MACCTRRHGRLTADKVRKAQARTASPVIEIERRDDGAWALVRPSPYARRITAHTPFAP